MGTPIFDGFKRFWTIYFRFLIFIDRVVGAPHTCDHINGFFQYLMTRKINIHFGNIFCHITKWVSAFRSGWVARGGAGRGGGVGEGRDTLNHKSVPMDAVLSFFLATNMGLSHTNHHILCCKPVMSLQQLQKRQMKIVEMLFFKVTLILCLAT